MELDTERLSVFSPAELGEIARDAIRAIAAQLQALDAALGGGELEAAREAAHRALGETLLIGARELSDALALLQEAAREGQLPRAREAFESARELWPQTRQAIAGLYDPAV